MCPAAHPTSVQASRFPRIYTNLIDFLAIMSRGHDPHRHPSASLARAARRRADVAARAAAAAARRARLDPTPARRARVPLRPRRSRSRRRGPACSRATACSARCWRSPARWGSRRCRGARPSRCSRPTTQGCSSSARRSASGAPSRCARPTPPTSTRCSTPARSASRCRPARSPDPTASIAAARCSSASRAATRRCSSTPGPALARWRPQPYAETDAPGWWPAMTRYIADMNAAWHAFAAFGAAAAPAAARRLRDARRRRAPAPRAARRPRRAGRRGRRPHLFYDTSSYGRARDRRARARVGIDQLVYGSDRPLVERHAPAARDAGAPTRWLSANRRAPARAEDPGRVTSTQRATSPAPELSALAARPRARRPARGATSSATTRTRAPTSSSAPRRARRDLAHLLDGRSRHRLSRPRRLLGALAVVQGLLREDRMRSAPARPRACTGPARRSTSRRRTSTAWRTAAAGPRSRSTPTRRHCGGWAPTSRSRGRSQRVRLLRGGASPARARGARQLKSVMAPAITNVAAHSASVFSHAAPSTAPRASRRRRPRRSPSRAASRRRAPDPEAAAEQRHVGAISVSACCAPQPPRRPAGRSARARPSAPRRARST